MGIDAPTLQAQAANLEVEAKSALLMDVATGTILFEQNSHEALAPASVTKVMTMLLVMEAIDSGKITWEDTVTASEAAASKGGSQVYLKVGETMSVSDMVKSIAVSSANDCACAMAEHIAGSEEAFVEQMNARAEELGMHIPYADQVRYVHIELPEPVQTVTEEVEMGIADAIAAMVRDMEAYFS